MVHLFRHALYTLWIFSSISTVHCSRLDWNVHTFGDDPEIHMNVSQIIKSKGYPCEEYDVHTEDGYILNIQRIPHSRSSHYSYTGSPKPVVLLQHGLLASSADWVLNPVNESLGFLLADAGFDVWLGNSRGNTYGKRHETLHPDDRAFWDFSWDEMGAYDLPATVERILHVTQAPDLVYIGFSQGTQIAFAQLSRNNTTLSQKIRLFVALAPVAYIGDIKSPLRYLAPFANDLGLLFSIFGYNDFLPSDWIFHWLARHVCGHEIPDILCENILFIFGGFDYNNMNMSRIPVYVAHDPAGTSVKNIIHYAQSIQSGKFRMFDYGADGNMNKYNQTTPPEYQPAKVSVPTALYSGGADWLAVPRDVGRLETELPRVIRRKIITDWEHLDFTWSVNAPEACYDDVTELIKQSYNIV